MNPMFPPKLSKNRQDKASNSNINVLPIVISSDQNSIDLTTAELNPEINQIESEAIPTSEILESEANLSIIGDEDKPEGKPEIVHQTSLTIEEEFNDSKRSPKVRLRRSLTDNGKNDSLLINDNDLPSIRDNEKTGHCSLVTLQKLKSSRRDFNQFKTKRLSPFLQIFKNPFFILLFIIISSLILI